MDNSAILTKAIETAIANGWLPETKFRKTNESKDAVEIREIYLSYGSPWDIIYSHSFAKTLWGIQLIKSQWFATQEDTEYWTMRPAWEVHLQQMVIAPDPIQYLAVNL